MAKIKVGQLAAEIQKNLSIYSKEVTEQINDSVGKVAKKSVKELKNTSPKETGKYSKGWTSKKEVGSFGSQVYVVHNKKRYQLAHLLEFGHAKRGGGRTAGRPHIKPVEDKAIREFTKKVEEAVKNAAR
jgi:hypothetical protein